MAERIIGLTEQDVKVLKDLIASVRGRPLNTQGRTFVDDPPDTAASSYIIKTPSAGIPARAGAGVSAATCRVYQRVDSDLVDAGFDRTVYNATGAVIDGNIYTTATRDPWGTLWADDVAGTGTTSGGGSGITSINDSTTASQTIGLGMVGTDINITTTAAAYDSGATYSRGMIASSGGSTYRYINATPTAGNAPPNVTYWVDVTGDGLTIVNVPDASTTADGLITKDAQTLGGEKTFDRRIICQGRANYTTLDIDFRMIGCDDAAIYAANGDIVSHAGYLWLYGQRDDVNSTASFFITGSLETASDVFGRAGFIARATVSVDDAASAWATSTVYAAGDSYVTNGGYAFRCHTTHTSGASNEPGVGADWQLHWNVLSASTGSVAVSPLMSIMRDSGSEIRCKTGSISGLNFVAGWCVGGSLDLTGVDGTTLSGLTIGTDVQAWSASLDSLVTAMPAADIGALTDSTGGTANTTLVAVAGTGDDANINDNFADLAAQVNAVRAALQTLGLMA